MERDLQDLVETTVQELGLPGMAVGVLVAGESITACAGVTSVEHPLPVDRATLFQIGSVTKTLTATVVVQLAEERRLALDDPVARYLPDLGTETGLDTDAMTIEHLISHQAGFDGDHLFAMREPESFAPLRHATRLFQPGTGCSYNNAAFSIAGAVIEAATGHRYRDEVRERLLAPLGLTTAGFSADEVITHRVAAPHAALGEVVVLRGLGWQPGWQLGRNDEPAGGLIASVDHLLTWARCQLTGRGPDGEAVLSEHVRSRLHEPVAELDAQTAIALDWFVRGDGKERTLEHGGATVGYTTDLVLMPSAEVAFVGLVNESIHGQTACQRVRRWVLERCAGHIECDPVPDPGLQINLERYEGTYLAPFATLTVAPGAEQGSIHMGVSARTDRAPWPSTWPPFPHEREAEVRFFAPDQGVDTVTPARVFRFAGDEGGRAAWCTWGYRRVPRTAGPGSDVG